MTRPKSTPSAARIRVSTPMGRDVVITVRDGAIVGSEFASRRSRQTERGDKNSAKAEDRRVLLRAHEEVKRYFDGRLDRFTVPLAFEGTPFECEVWRQVSQLRFGEFVSYADIARACGRPLSHRGVARAMGRTQHALFVPAQRVVGADGRPRGLSPKGTRAWLIRFERERTSAGYKKIHGRPPLVAERYRAE